MIKMRSIFCFAVLAALQIPARAESGAGFLYKWNVHGFYAAGSALAETTAGLRGGGGGAELFVWKRFAAGADVSALHDQYYWALGNVGHVGAQVSYHFASREKIRGVDPFLLFGVGRFFPEESRAVVHGSFGLAYWFKPHVGARFEIRVAERQYGDNIYAILRAGIAFR